MKVRVEDIIVKRRIRKDAGDISELMESISKFGLLNPITVSEQLELIAGFRRLEAFKALGLEEIECNIIPVSSKVDKLLIEADENLTRKDLNPREIGIYEEEKRYLLSRGFERIRLWIIRLFRMIMRWIKEHFPGNRD